MSPRTVDDFKMKSDFSTFTITTPFIIIYYHYFFLRTIIVVCNSWFGCSGSLRLLSWSPSSYCTLLYIFYLARMCVSVSYSFFFIFIHSLSLSLWHIINSIKFRRIKHDFLSDNANFWSLTRAHVIIICIYDARVNIRVSKIRKLVNEMRKIMLVLRPSSPYW